MFEARISRKIVIALLLVCASVVYSQKRTSKPKLALIISTEKPSISMSEGLHLELEFVNDGSGPILLYRELGAGVGRTNLRIFDDHGKEVMTIFLADELPPPPPPHRKESFVEIKRNESYRTKLEDSLKNIVNGPGTYEMVIEYTSTISEGWARRYLSLPVERIWTRERGMIVSNHIRITVTN
jgi:hypothetical protein